MIFIEKSITPISLNEEEGFYPEIWSRLFRLYPLASFCIRAFKFYDYSREC